MNWFNTGLCRAWGYHLLYPQLATMRALPAWKKANEATEGFAATLKDKPFVRVA